MFSYFSLNILFLKKDFNQYLRPAITLMLDIYIMRNKRKLDNKSVQNVFLPFKSFNRVAIPRHPVTFTLNWFPPPLGSSCYKWYPPISRLHISHVNTLFMVPSCPSSLQVSIDSFSPFFYFRKFFFQSILTLLKFHPLI